MKKGKLFYNILSAFLFVLTAFSFWEFVYILSNMIGSIVCASPNQALVELIRMLPFMLMTFAAVYMSVYVHKAYRAKDDNGRRSQFKRSGIFCICYGSVIVIYVAAGCICGEYGSLVEGYISPFFPLDVMLSGFFIILIGALSIKLSGILARLGDSTSYYNELSPNGKRRRPVHFFYVISYLHAACGFAAVIYSPWVLDFSHGNILYNIALILNYAAAAAMFILYRYSYLLTDTTTRRQKGLRYSIGFLIVNSILVFFYIFITGIENEAPNLNAYGLLPIDYSASVNAFLILYGLNNIITPLTSLIYLIRTGSDNPSSGVQS